MSADKEKMLLENIQNALNKFNNNPGIETCESLHKAINEFINQGGNIGIKINGQSLYHLCLFPNLKPMIIDMETLTTLLNKGLTPDEDLLTKFFRFEKENEDKRNNILLMYNYNKTPLDSFSQFYKIYVNNGIVPNTKIDKLPENYVPDRFIEIVRGIIEDNPNHEYIDSIFYRFIDKHDDTVRYWNTRLLGSLRYILDNEPNALNKIKNYISYCLHCGVLDLNKRMDKYTKFTPLEYFLASNTDKVINNIKRGRSTPEALENFREVIKILMGDNLTEENKKMALSYVQKIEDSILMILFGRTDVDKATREESLDINLVTPPGDNILTAKERNDFRLWHMSLDIINTINRPIAPPSQALISIGGCGNRLAC